MFVYRPSEQLCSVLAFTTHTGMEAFHPLAADADAPPEDVALAQAECAFALGQLDGLLAGLTETEQALLSTGLLRAVLLAAL